MDFMETGGLNRLNSPVFSVDAVVMNPPFEKGQDVAHVLHAWRSLKTGGTLVAIMGAGVTFRQGKPYAPFRDRSEEHTSELQSLMRSSYAVFGLKIKKVKRLYLVTELLIHI